MLSLEDLRFFTTVARSRTLAAAARELDVTPPAVTQRLRQIEARLKVRLLDRSTRHLVLTDEGEVLATRGLAILADIDDITDTLATRRGAVRGHLRIVAPFGFGRRFVAPVVAAFQRNNPEITATLTLSENPYQLPRESWDVLVHIGELRDSSLISHRLAPNNRIVCAAPEYLQRHGTLRTPDDLRDHSCIALRENNEDVTLWHFTRPRHPAATIRIHPTMATNDGDVARGWALAGLGIIVRSEWDVADDLRSGRLVQVLRQWSPPPADAMALLGERNSRTARTSRFVAMLKASLQPPPWRTELSPKLRRAP